jgi:hypothetical protein
MATAATAAAVASTATASAAVTAATHGKITDHHTTPHLPVLLACYQELVLSCW